MNAKFNADPASARNRWPALSDRPGLALLRTHASVRRYSDVSDKTDRLLEENEAMTFARRFLFTPAALLAPCLLTGCMGSAPKMVNVEPSYVHERHASADDRIVAAWPVMPTQQSMVRTRANIAEAAYLER